MTFEPQNDHILASLALQLGKPHGHQVGTRPSDEELAAILDNRLNAVRRAQIMSHIANDASTYQRWISVVQAAADFSGEQDVKQSSKAKKEHSAESGGLFSRLAAALFGNSLRAGVLGGGFATAAMVFAVVLLLPSLDDMTRIDAAYDQWSPDIMTQWDSSTHSPKMSSGTTRAFKIRLEAEKVLTYGYHRGAKTLGLSKYQALGIPLELELGAKPIRSATLSQKHYKSLLALGRLTALTTLQCELSSVKQDFSMIYKTVRHLSRELRELPDVKMSALVAQFPQQTVTTEKQTVCEFTDKVIVAIM